MALVKGISTQFAALAEPTRLRLLLACRGRELSVGQLADVLRLPEPAISRHLGVLARAGFLTRERMGREVRYQWSAAARNSTWLSVAIAPALEGDATVRHDLTRLARLDRQAVEGPFAADSVFGQRLAASLRLLANNITDAHALALHVRQGPVLEWLHAAAGELAVVASETALRHSITAFAREQEISFVWAGEHKPVAEFDLVCVTASAADSLEQRLADAARWLAPSGRVLLGLPYDALEQSAGNGGAHPLLRLRAMLTAQGFACERLLPLEAAGEHWLLACGSLTASHGAVARQG